MSIVPCQLQFTLADGGVVQAAQLAALALKVVDDQEVIVPGMPVLGLINLCVFNICLKF